MKLRFMDGNDFRKGLIAGAQTLGENKELVNSLNVFPVPDGDTGTNMYLTVLSAVKESEKVSQSGIGKVATAASMGSLMGARGNSGVIFAGAAGSAGTSNHTIRSTQLSLQRRLRGLQLLRTRQS